MSPSDNIREVIDLTYETEGDTLSLSYSSEETNDWDFSEGDPYVEVLDISADEETDDDTTDTEISVSSSVIHGGDVILQFMNEMIDITDNRNVEESYDLSETEAVDVFLHWVNNN